MLHVSALGMPSSGDLSDQSNTCVTLVRMIKNMKILKTGGLSDQSNTCVTLVRMIKNIKMLKRPKISKHKIPTL